MYINYNNLPAKYTMTETRGRALLISNEFRQSDGSYRRGSEHDYRNMRALLVRMGFIVVGDHKSYTAQVFVYTLFVTE